MVSITIRNAVQSDIARIAKIENAVARYHRVSQRTLTLRLKMFPAGFFVAELNKQIVGYLESCSWDKESFRNFNEICNFPKLHEPTGKNLYIIYLATHSRYRNMGIGSALLRALKRFARMHGKRKIQLVASANVKDFYLKCGFHIKMVVHNFFPKFDGLLMEHIFDHKK